MSKHGMLFVQGTDRPGIIKTVTQILFAAGANLEDVSMTLLEGQFAMMLSFEIQSEKWKNLSHKTTVLKKSPWKMNVDLISITRRSRAQKKSEKSVLITAIGKDRTGIVYQLSSGLAQIQANITNLDCRLLHRLKGGDFYSLALEADLKKTSDLIKIKSLVKRWERKLGIEIKFHSSEAAVF